MGTANAMLSELFSKDVRTHCYYRPPFRQLVYRTIPQFSINRLSAFRDDYLNGLKLPYAHGHYKLRDNCTLRLTPYLESGYLCYSLLDRKVAQGRKRPRKVSTEEFLAQQNAFWESIQTVGCPDARSSSQG